MSILVMSLAIFLLLLISEVTSIDPDLGAKDKGNLKKSLFKNVVSLNQFDITVSISQIK